jgi:prevent-host-death family protein
MKVTISAAKGRLTELVRLAEAGDDVVLTRRGQPIVRLTPLVTLPDAASRRALMEKIRAVAVAKAKPGPRAARSQDFLYGDDGLPG